MKKYTKGFTLIELLVVIAIIGILSSVVLVSLNSARGKGKDACVQTEVAQIRAQLEANYVSHYGDDMSAHASHINNIAGASANLGTLLSDITSQQGGLTIGGAAGPGTGTYAGAGVVGTGITIWSTATAGSPSDYAIYAKLSNGGYTCIDSYGKTLITTVAYPTVWASVNTAGTVACK